jgi:hypothetical protein
MTGHAFSDQGLRILNHNALKYFHPLPPGGNDPHSLLYLPFSYIATDSMLGSDKLPLVQMAGGYSSSLIRNLPWLRSH